jgi:hypothetical protein
MFWGDTKYNRCSLVDDNSHPCAHRRDHPHHDIYVHKDRRRTFDGHRDHSDYHHAVAVSAFNEHHHPDRIGVTNPQHGDSDYRQRHRRRCAPGQTYILLLLSGGHQHVLPDGVLRLPSLGRRRLLPDGEGLPYDQLSPRRHDDHRGHARRDRRGASYCCY